MRDFDFLVQQHSDPETYEAFETAIMRHTKGETSVEEFRNELELIFRNNLVISQRIAELFHDPNDRGAPYDRSEQTLRRSKQQPKKIAGQQLHKTVNKARVAGRRGMEVDESESFRN